MTDASQANASYTADASMAAPVVEGAPEASLEITTEKLAGRARRICAAIAVPCSVEHLWQVLTDYDNLSSFIPNLTLSRRLEATPTGTRLEQIGAQCFLNIQFCARVVLDMVEQFPHRLGFSMVEGDFKSFEGCWTLEPTDNADQAETRLVYELTVCPPRAIPAVLIERHLRRDLAQNLQAIRQHAIALAS